MAGLVVDRAARTISGVATPYDRSAVSGSRAFRFLPGWARYSGRVRLLLDHDPAQRLGRALQITDTPGGLAVVLLVDRGRRGDRALDRVATGGLGLSPHARLDRTRLARDPDDPHVLLVAAADLVELSLTARPAFEMR